MDQKFSFILSLERIEIRTHVHFHFSTSVTFRAPRRFATGAFFPTLAACPARFWIWNIAFRWLVCDMFVVPALIFDLAAR